MKTKESIKKISRQITTLLLVIVFCISMSMVGLAKTQDEIIPNPTATLRITGATRSETQEIPLSDDDVIIETVQSGANTYTTVATVTLNNDTLNQLFSSTDSDHTYKDGDIALIAGITYRLSGRAVSMLNVFGSYIPSGSFYPTNRRVDWANSVNACRGQAYPGSNNWQYTTDSTYVEWNYAVPPYVRSECTINVSGMGGTGYNSAQFDLRL